MLLGSNLGLPAAHLEVARQHLRTRVGRVLRASHIYRTAAWGQEQQPDFLNQVLVLQTALAPVPLLEALLQIEQDMGRQRQEKWGPRLIDIDLLYYHQQQVNLPQLQVPHPFIAQRRFTLVPLVQLAPQALHPMLGLSHEALLAQCPDPLPVHLEQQVP